MKIFDLLPKSRLSRASFFYTLLFISVIIYFEFFDVWSNSSSWTTSKASADIRMLIVADPQLLGEHGELPFLGVFTRWHSDRYVAQNFRVAKERTKPRVILFLGDLLDEGLSATEEESARYLQRFQSVFQLGKYSKKKDDVLHIYVPGDNDVGGESGEKVVDSKVRWFSSTFGDLQSPVILDTHTLKLQFSKVLLPSDHPELRKPGTPVPDVPGANPGIHIALSHFPCLEVQRTCAEMLMSKRPNILLSAHMHVAEYVQYNQEGSVKYVLPNLFLPGSEGVDGTREAAERMGLDLTSSSLRWDLKRNHSVFHEILNPTCSYRMGQKHAGFGLLTIDKEGHSAHYQVLWLPNGFKPLIIYITFYIVSKLIFTPWILWRLVLCFWPRFRRIITIQGRPKTVTSSGKAHLV